MKALSIRQPWAWLIVHAGKDIENRTWQTKFRGRFLVHAAGGMSLREYRLVQGWARQHAGVTNLPAFEELQRGGIIGSVELVDCVTDHPSPWYMGDVGFVLRDPKPLPFVPVKGRLNFFEVEGVEG